MRDVIGIHREKNLAMLDDGSVITVTHWMDEDGDFCLAKDAIVCVAGSDEAGWYTIDLSFFSGNAMVH
jgi:hypothetical protein